jgi:hypothetical protein
MKKFYVAILLLISCISNAATINSTQTSIAALYPTRDGLAFLTDSYSSTLSTCDGGKRFMLNKANLDYNAQASALIAAFMANKQVSLIIISDSTACSPLIDRFWVWK